MAGVFPVFFPPICGGCGNISLSHLMRHVILWRMLLLCSFNIYKASTIRRFNRICNAAEQKLLFLLHTFCCIQGWPISHLINGRNWQRQVFVSSQMYFSFSRNVGKVMHEIEDN